MRAQSAEAKARMARAIEEKVWPLIAEGKLKPVIDSTSRSPTQPPRMPASTTPITSARSCWWLNSGGFETRTCVRYSPLKASS